MERLKESRVSPKIENQNKQGNHAYFAFFRNCPFCMWLLPRHAQATLAWNDVQVQSKEKVLESEPNFEFRNLKKGNLRLPEPQALQNVESPVGNAKSVASIREILSRAQLESNPILRNASFAQAVGRLNAENLQEVLETFESMPLGFEHMHEYRMLLYAWGQFDPIAAIDYCKMRASGIGAGFATLGVLEGWASRDPQSARTWVEHPENEGMAKLYNFVLVRGWVSRDLEAAGKYVQELGDDEDLTKISGILINQHKKGGGFAQASTWTEGLSNGKLKVSAFNGMSREFARDQPRKLASWLETHANNKYASNAFEYLGKNGVRLTREARSNTFPTSRWESLRNWA